MNTKSVLLVTSAFYPEISPRSFRATELAKEFCRQGNQVVVISKYRDHDYSDFLEKYPVTFKMWKKPVFNGLPDFKHKPFSLLTRVLTRLLSLLFEYPDICEMGQVKKMLENEGGHDLIISFAVPFPIHWGVAWAFTGKHKIAKTWIADCGDPYMFARLDSFKKPFYFKYFEVNFCTKCNYISIPFEAMRNQFYPQFKSKIKVIPQGINFDDIQLYNGPRNNSIPLFIFAGSIIPGKRDLALFLDFLATLQINFLFVIYTNQMEWCGKYLKSLDKKLELHGYIERLSLIYEMSKADFLVNIDTLYDNNQNTEAIPSKLIDYSLTNRPILNINSASLDREKVMRFLKKDYSGQRVIDKTKYDIKEIAYKFLELIGVD